MARCLGSRGPRILKPTLFKMSCFNEEAFQGVFPASPPVLLSPFPISCSIRLNSNFRGTMNLMGVTQTISDCRRSHLNR